MTLVNENGMPALIAALRAGLDYYTFAAQEARDPEVTEAFTFAATCRAQLLDLLQERITQQPSAPLTTPDAAAYAQLRAQFDPRHPELQGRALLERERQMVRLVESAFRTESSLAVRRALKAVYPQLIKVQGIMQRLAQRAHSGLSAA